jgi:hypothetical protein
MHDMADKPWPVESDDVSTYLLGAQIRNAKATLKEFLPVFPDIFNSVKTGATPTTSL